MNAADSYDSDGSLASFAWNFNDGATDTGMSVTHLFAQAGTYVVQLTVTDNQGATASKTRAITVTTDNQPPAAQFSVACTDGQCEFEAGASADPDGEILRFDWDFGDGNNALGTSVSHRYQAAGTFLVTLEITDNDGGTGVTQKTLSIDSPDEAPDVPAGNTSGDGALTPVLDSICNDSKCNFSAADSQPGAADIVSYDWDLGDGTTGNGVELQHTFKDTGKYLVKLTVTDSHGYKSSKTRAVTVKVKPAIKLMGNTNSLNGRVSAVLKWSGATAQQVDLYRDGKMVSRIQNLGRYIDKDLKAYAKAVRYQLCEQDYCSAEVTLKVVR